MSRVAKTGPVDPRGRSPRHAYVKGTSREAGPFSAPFPELQTQDDARMRVWGCGSVPWRATGMGIGRERRGAA